MGLWDEIAQEHSNEEARQRFELKYGVDRDPLTPMGTEYTELLDELVRHVPPSVYSGWQHRWCIVRPEGVYVDWTDTHLVEKSRLARWWDHGSSKNATLANSTKSVKGPSPALRRDGTRGLTIKMQRPLEFRAAFIRVDQLWYGEGSPLLSDVFSDVQWEVQRIMRDSMR